MPLTKVYQDNLVVYVVDEPQCIEIWWVTDQIQAEL
jgi:hypothetical protein